MAYFIELTRSTGSVWVNVEHIASFEQGKTNTILRYAGGTATIDPEKIFVEESVAEILTQIPKNMRDRLAGED